MPIEAVCGSGPKGRLSAVVLRREDVPRDLSKPVEVWEPAFMKRGFGLLVDPEISGEDLTFSLLNAETRVR